MSRDYTVFQLSGYDSESENTMDCAQDSLVEINEYIGGLNTLLEEETPNNALLNKIENNINLCYSKIHADLFEHIGTNEKAKKLIQRAEKLYKKAKRLLEELSTGTNTHAQRHP